MRDIKVLYKSDTLQISLKDNSIYIQKQGSYLISPTASLDDIIYMFIKNVINSKLLTPQEIESFISRKNLSQIRYIFDIFGEVNARKTIKGDYLFNIFEIKCDKHILNIFENIFNNQGFNIYLYSDKPYIVISTIRMLIEYCSDIDIVYTACEKILENYIRNDFYTTDTKYLIRKYNELFGHINFTYITPDTDNINDIYTILYYLDSTDIEKYIENDTVLSGLITLDSIVSTYILVQPGINIFPTFKSIQKMIQWFNRTNTLDYDRFLSLRDHDNIIGNIIKLYYTLVSQIKNYNTKHKDMFIKIYDALIENFIRVLFLKGHKDHIYELIPEQFIHEHHELIFRELIKYNHISDKIKLRIIDFIVNIVDIEKEAIKTLIII